MDKVESVDDDGEGQKVKKAKSNLENESENLASEEK